MCIEVVTMASLVERETAVDAERPLVASVFENRLAKKMPLMTDPAVIYGLGARWALAGHHLRERPEAQHARTTPICTPACRRARWRIPACESLRAAMSPARTGLPLLCGRGGQSPGAVDVFKHFDGTRARCGRLSARSEESRSQLKSACRRLGAAALLFPVLLISGCLWTHAQAAHAQAAGGGADGDAG